MKKTNKRKFLVLYTINYFDVRNTINEHLFSFKKYANDIEFHYFNVIFGIPKYLKWVNYDGIILHYTFLAERYPRKGKKWNKFINGLKYLKGHKIAIPQDEYYKTDVLCQLFKDYHVKTVFTCFNQPEDYLKAYPKEKTGLKCYIPVFTGYVDEKAIENLNSNCQSYKERPIDIGYRARKLPYVYGRHGQLKYELGNTFLDKLKDTTWNIDISLTEEQKNAFLGSDWYSFLLGCKAVLGCEGGSSLLDSKGEIWRKVVKYLENYSRATFEEVEQACFPGEDFNIKCFALSPRNFECVITKTCQVLVEGNYGGIFKPNVHYIELKKDYSNIDKVLELLKDNEYCQNIVDQAYDDIVLSGKYTYKVFANNVINHILENVVNSKEDRKTDSFLNRFSFYVLGRYLLIRDNFISPLLITFSSPKKLYTTILWFLKKIFGEKLYYSIVNPIKKVLGLR